jgi:hypothetical protein
MLRHAHLSQELVLQRRIVELNKSERAMFPSSVREYHALKNKDVQLRIARFLMMDSVGKEKIMSEFGWTWKKVQKLDEQYEHNVSFSPIFWDSPFVVGITNIDGVLE